jgi:REP element-mobilizing transposase RayT
VEKKHKQIRLRHFDYGNAGSYYITICTYKRQLLLSAIKNNEVHLTETGNIVKEELGLTIALRNYLELDYSVIMPNHVHFILLFKDRAANALDERTDKALRSFGGSHQHSLSSVIAQFKAAVTNRVRKSVNNDKFQLWQKGFYEHIIRDDKDLARIRDYISTNAINWQVDQENPDRIKL